MTPRTFREDLYYRLNVIPIHLPALRDRRDDIPLLVSHFLQNKSSTRGNRPFQVTRKVMEILCAHDWPGNVRELENAIERAVTLCEADVVRVNDLPPSLVQKSSVASVAEEAEDTAALPDLPEGTLYPLKVSADSESGEAASAKPATSIKSLKNFLRDQEIAHLNRALEQAGGDKEKAALILGVSLATLYRKLAGDEREG